MVSTEERWTLGANTGLFILELESRGIEVELIDRFQEVLVARYRDHEELLVGYFSSMVPHVQASIADNKYLLKKILERIGVSFVPGSRFDAASLGYAYAYAKELGLPVVFKPVHGSGGAFVVLDLADVDAMDDAIDALARARGPKAPFLIEKQISYHEYRIFLTRHGHYAAVFRDPAHVVGDGRQTIRELAHAESYRRDHLAEDNCLCPLRLDERVDTHLAKLGLTLDSRPADGEKIYLRKNSNASDGATVDDVTDRVHRSVLEPCMKALRFLSLPYLGFDVLSRDIGAPHGPDDYYILEANSRPSVGMHKNPGRGAHRDAFVVIADMMFPETASTTAPSGNSYHPLDPL